MVISFFMKINIAIITGGNSSEYVISVKSAQTILENIEAAKYQAYRIEISNKGWFVDFEGEAIPIDKNDFSFKVGDKAINFNCALIMIHGAPGEDGKLQGYFDMLGIPYTSSNVLSSALTFSKHYTKQFLKGYNIQSADWMFLNKHLGYNLNDVAAKIGFPCFVKPNNAGSSFGISKVNEFSQLEDAVRKALTEDNEVLVEKMVEGTEITCGVIRTSKSVHILPVTEIVSKTGFFDYDAKYTEGLADEIVPARIPTQIAEQCKELSLKIYDIFNCKWFARVDYILNNGELYLLEINTIPGMSQESIVPKMLKYEGLKLTQIIDEVITDSLAS